MTRVKGMTAALVALTSPSASAHLVSTRFGDLYNGMLHPLLALEHVVPWIGIALMGAMLDSKHSRWVLLVFPLTVLIGAVAGTLLSVASWISIANLASVIIVGAAVATNVRMPIWMFMTLVLAFGITHGCANAAAGLTGNAQWLFALGVALSAYLLITLSMAAAFMLRQRASWGRTALRAAGSWIMAIGIVFSGFSWLT